MSELAMPGSNPELTEEIINHEQAETQVVGFASLLAVSALGATVLAHRFMNSRNIVESTVSLAGTSLLVAAGFESSVGLVSSLERLHDIEQDQAFASLWA